MPASVCKPITNQLISENEVPRILHHLCSICCWHICCTRPFYQERRRTAVLVILMRQMGCKELRNCVWNMVVCSKHQPDFAAREPSATVYWPKVFSRTTQEPNFLAFIVAMTTARDTGSLVTTKNSGAMIKLRFPVMNENVVTSVRSQPYCQVNSVLKPPK